MVDVGTILFSLCSVNKSSYIYIELCCYLIKTPTKLRFPPLYILKTKAKLLVFVLFTLAQNSDGPQTFKSVYLLCIQTVYELLN